MFVILVVLFDFAQFGAAGQDAGLRGGVRADVTGSVARGWNVAAVCCCPRRTVRLVRLSPRRDGTCSVVLKRRPGKVSGPVHTGRGAPCNTRMQIMEHTTANGSIHIGCKPPV